MPEPKMFTEQEVRDLLTEIESNRYDPYQGLQGTFPCSVVDIDLIRSAFTSLLHPQEGSKA